MTKMMVGLVALVALVPFVALTVGACSSATAQPTGCVPSYPDAGATPGVVCDIGWSCSDDSQHYRDPLHRGRRQLLVHLHHGHHDRGDGGGGQPVQVYRHGGAARGDRRLSLGHPDVSGAHCVPAPYLA